MDFLFRLSFGKYVRSLKIDYGIDKIVLHSLEGVTNGKLSVLFYIGDVLFSDVCFYVNEGETKLRNIIRSVGECIEISEAKKFWWSHTMNVICSYYEGDLTKEDKIIKEQQNQRDEEDANKHYIYTLEYVFIDDCDETETHVRLFDSEEKLWKAFKEEVGDIKEDNFGDCADLSVDEFIEKYSNSGFEDTKVPCDFRFLADEEGSVQYHFRLNKTEVE